MSIANKADIIFEVQEKLQQLEIDSSLYPAVLSILTKTFEESDILTVCTNYFVELSNGDHVSDDITEDDITTATNMLADAGLLDSTFIVNANERLHWLHTKLLQKYSEEEITNCPLYSMLEMYPPGTMLPDSNGTFWVRRARAAITRHRFISLDDQETYYEQKYLLNIPLSPKDKVITNPPESWIKIAMHAGLVDEHHDAMANLMDAVKRGFTLDSIQSIIKIYLEHQFLDEDEADTFLSSLPIGSSIKEEGKRSYRSTSGW